LAVGKQFLGGKVELAQAFEVEALVAVLEPGRGGRAA
jgi:hypothetical protein